MSVPETPQGPGSAGGNPPPAATSVSPTGASPQRNVLQTWLTDLWNAARLHPPVFAGLASRPDAFLQGFLIVLVISLLTGIPAFFGAIITGMQPPAGETAELSVALREGLEAAGPSLEQLGVPAETRAVIIEQVAQAFGLALQIRQEVDQLPTALPRPVGRLLEALGGWLSQPFARAPLPLAVASLGAWLGYGVWVMLAAKLLGGRGSLHGFFGATALYAVPHVLDLFRWLPFFGGVLALIAYVWGWVIFIKATQASHEFSFERALAAALLPLALVALVLAGVVSVLAGIAWLQR